jgi:hypothetical protein
MTAPQQPILTAGASGLRPARQPGAGLGKASAAATRASRPGGPTERDPRALALELPRNTGANRLSVVEPEVDDDA